MRRNDLFLSFLDLVQGTKIRKFLNFFLESSQWNRKEIQRYQLIKLKELIDYSYNHVQFYKEILDKKNLSFDSFKEIQDLKKIPPLTRSDIQNNFNKLISDQHKKLKYNRSSSSGTTGIPIQYFHDIQGESAGKAAGYFFYYLSGWNFGKKSIHIWGNPTSIQHWGSPLSRLKRVFLNQYNFPASELNSSVNFEKLIRLINNIKPFSIDGYSNSIYNLACYILDKNLEIHKPKIVFTTAENLFESQKNIIENVLGPVSDIYGCGEINGIAVRPINDDKYYILDPHVIVETEPVKGTNMKEIIVTNLDNKIMPLIRYKVGDLIDDVYEGDDDNTIRYSYFKKIHGRSADIIDLGNGKFISPITLFGGTLFRDIGGIMKHKVVWNGKVLNFLFEVNSKFIKDMAQKKIERELKPYHVIFKITIVDNLQPDKNGKFKYVEIIK